MCELRCFTFWTRWINRPVPDPPRTDMLDDDVVKEHDRVAQIHENLAVRAFDLRKVYNQWSAKPLVACKKISFALDYGDCFALLGINGAGKTSTFKMLTGEIRPNSGNMNICDHNVQNNFSKVRRHIGYCP